MSVCLGWTCDRMAECALHTSNIKMLGKVQFLLPERKGEFCEHYLRIDDDRTLQAVS